MTMSKNTETKASVVCHDCGKVIVPPADGISTGYGQDAEGHKICFKCCGVRDSNELEALAVGEKYFLYLSQKNGEYRVSNWPGSLSIKVDAVREGLHNWAGSRTDVWFSFRGKRFHGIQYGDSNEICHIQRVKRA